jgi:predicted NAD-dependent protein-ADP-ribosyltransferase YbiA (DUF1768 family)
MKKPAHIAIHKYMQACKVPLFLILSLSFEEKAFMQLDKLNPESGIIAPAPKEPNDARNIAHENKEYRLSNWSDVKYQNMEKVLRLKVEQNPIVKDVLLNTKDYIIAENCIDEDTDWGLDSNNQGDNNLGKIWMKIRDDIKEGNTHE